MGRRGFAGVARASGVALFGAFLHLAAGECLAGTPKDRFKGETMTYIVAAEPGSASDTYGRLVARYLPKHLGLAKVVVENEPGDGQIQGTNAIYAARPNGLTIGTFSAGVVYAQLLRLEQVKFDLEKMSWIGKAGDEPRMLVVSSKSGYRTLEDVRKAPHPLVVGSAGLGSSSYNDMRLLAYVFGLDARYVVGLATRDAQLAMKRGDLEAQFGSASSHRPFITGHYGRAILRVGSGPGVDEKIPDAADLATTDEGRAAVALVRSQAMLLRMTAGPPGIPDDRLLALRMGYTAAIEDPALLAEARKLDIPLAPMDGATLAVKMKEALRQPPHIVAMIEDAGVRSDRPIARSSAELTAVEQGGLAIRFHVRDTEIASRIDPAHATLALDGKTATPASLTVGMKCDISYDARADHAVRAMTCASAR